MTERTFPEVVRREQWLARRVDLLAREKAFDKARDQLAAARRELPMVAVDKAYLFETPAGPVSLRELFGAKTQLIVYHFMFEPDWEQGCKSCSLLADSFDGAIPHLGARDVAFVAISRASLDKLLTFQRRMGWAFRWVSSGETDFNYDFGVSVRPEDLVDGQRHYNYATRPSRGGDLPGLSVFLRRDDEVFHTYSTYSRGLDLLITAYNYMDLTPRGRDEADLAYTMEWVRHHDRYG